MNLRRGLPHRRSSCGHNWRSAKAQKIFPPPNLRHSLSFSFTLTLIHCNTVMHRTSSQRTCHLPQRKRATSATQGQGSTTYCTPLSAHRNHNEFRVFPKPRQRSSLRLHPGPPSTRPTSPPLEIVLANPPQHNSPSFEMLLHVEAHRWASHLRRAARPKANLAQPAAQLGWRFFGTLHSQTASPERTSDWPSKKEARCPLG